MLLKLIAPPDTAIDLQKINLIFHVQMFGLRRSKRSVIVIVIQSKDDSNKRTSLFFDP